MATITSPIGLLEVQVSPIGVSRVRIINPEGAFSTSASNELEQSALFMSVVEEIQAYFLGALRCFSVPLDFSGLGEFQSKVLDAAQSIPFGEIKTYAQIAKFVGRPGAARAVGTSLARNQLLLLVPCHRVVGSDQKMHGFASPDGINTKIWLLHHEGHEIVNGKLLR
ncbi:MAG: methylated-DNA--[protein]-cysteine S-methyltransferase [Anaerolineaceae bacterium]